MEGTKKTSSSEGETPGPSRLDRVVEKASRLVTPSKPEIERLKRVATKVSALIENRILQEPASEAPKLSIGGSYARGTWLRGSLDIDFFLLYPTSYPRERLETRAVDFAKKTIEGYPTNMRFAEHPYVEAFVDNVRVNLVPCYDVAPGEWKSAADRSPYHTKYMSLKLTERLRLEARLLKKFVKASGVYGAEVKVQGFSGYVCEVLTLKNGSFHGSMESFSRLNPKDVISVEPYDQDLAASSFKSAIVILDPVDTTRNLGSAISARSVARLAIQSRRFLANPKLSYFSERKEESLKKRERIAPELSERMLVLTFNTSKRSPDILWGQLKKSVGALDEKLSSLGYQVSRSSAAVSEEGTKCAFLFLLVSTSIPSLQLRAGPEYFRGEEVDKYFRKNQKRALLTWIADDGRVKSLFRREKFLLDAKDALNYLLSKEKIREIGLSEEIRNELSNRKSKFNTHYASELLSGRKKEELIPWLSSEIARLGLRE